ncbi:MAG TPA: ATP-binding protein [Acidimicrobiales bacterium]|jgi:two-component system, OmpR family, sensor histidine kinase SenX3|nr:ATP-binding protein [Acidimicrobiales bacterium]
MDVVDLPAAIAFAVVAALFAVGGIVAALRSMRAAANAADELARSRTESEAQVESAALASERLADAFALLDHGVVILDEQGNVLLQNEVAASVLRDPVGGALVASTVDRLVMTAMAGSESEETLDLFGPPRRTLKVSARPLDSGRLIGVAVVIDDITERRRLEAVRRDFIANISHELKTPIGALGLLAETLVDEGDPEVVQRLAQRMQGEALRVGRIIEDLLDLSRIESEEAPRREPVPVHLVLGEATERLREAADQRGVVLEVCDDAGRLTTVGDRRQLVSAVHSLVENAITYTDAGGTVRVTAERSGERVVISVVDTGVGIPARDLDRIFERFYRVDRARARATGGTGLGLSIVRHVAHNHGGEVHVESQEGVGSTFRLELPAGPAYPVLEAG